MLHAVDVVGIQRALRRGLRKCRNGQNESCGEGAESSHTKGKNHYTGEGKNSGKGICIRFDLLPGLSREIQLDLIDIAPAPVLTGFERPDDWMMRVVKVFSSVLVF